MSKDLNVLVRKKMNSMLHDGSITLMASRSLLLLPDISGKYDICFFPQKSGSLSLRP